MALIDEQSNINYYHTDQIGTPRELTNEKGKIVWEAQYKTWGNVAKESYNQTDSKLTQSFRFQGQYFDAKTGLHYNRFRYYDADVGRFISQDPIGLLGGNNLYQYAPNPTGWVDPFGLAKSSGFGCGCDLDGDGEISKDEMFTLYHGTDSETAKLIMENGQELKYSRNNLDFGKGIYTTENKEQAIEWAKKSGKRNGTTGAVIEYKVPKDKIESLNTKEFSMNSKDYENRIVTPNSELDSMYRNERTAYNTTKRGKEIHLEKGMKLMIMT
ncbi:MAG: Rhs-family protein [uncultured Sulfurovum sp.]|uniref:Rhs-family protein n=1 Tax=uncultured Sulfurovum sp. TaxID=269237 RepID=A0A6S6SWT3_9BACT|nr:MAG: Rhs-family protein [uncultured Sulfurovum sp.]